MSYLQVAGMPAERRGLAADSAGPHARARSRRRSGYVDQVCELVPEERPDAACGEDYELTTFSGTGECSPLSFYGH